jgi:putative transcriptional regulator
MDDELFEELLESARLMKRDMRGENVGAQSFEITPKKVQAIRRKTGLSQQRFAQVIDVKLNTLQNWEQGQRTPSGPAGVLLRVIDRIPGEVIAAIGKVALPRTRRSMAKPKMSSRGAPSAPKTAGRKTPAAVKKR